MTSFVYVDSNKVGHLKRIYGADMPSGRIIATGWEKGPQAKILPPGFHFNLFIRVMYDFEEWPVIQIPAEELVTITAKDGRPLPEGQYMADEWPEKDVDKYLNAEFFMGADAENGQPRGQRGPQLTVLKPGTYRLNLYLFEISKPTPATEVHAGFVGVVKSNVGKKYTSEPIVPKSIVESYVEASRLEVEHRRNKLTKMLEQIKDTEKAAVAVPDKAPVAIPSFTPSTEMADPKKLEEELASLKIVSEEEARKMALTNLSNPLVPQGHIGVWETVLLPGKYYLNPIAYTLTQMDTRVQTWRYEGGYTRRYINLVVGNDGTISQTTVEENITQPQDAADSAINHKVEGWDVWLDSRLLVQVTPENAPFVVAYVGDMQQVEDRIITPMYRSVSRNILGSREVKVLQILYERQTMEEAVEAAIKPEGLKTGLIVRDARFGDPYVPPELLIPGKRMQLAQQLNDTFNQEKSTQETRIQAEKKKAEADQQSTLISAQIKRQADEQLGLGAKARLENEAEGQRAQANVLGQEKTYELALFRELLAVLKDHPELVKVPNILVAGDSNNLSAAAAILGNSTLSKAVTGMSGK